MKLSNNSLFFFSLLLTFINSDYTTEQHSFYSENSQQINSLYPQIPSAPAYPSLPTAPYSPNHFSPPPGSLFPHTFSYAHANGSAGSHHYQQDSCYRTTGSLPIPISSSVPNFVQSELSGKGHHRNRSKSVSDIEILSAQLEATRLELAKAHSTIAILHSKPSHKLQGQYEDNSTQTDTHINPPTTKLETLEFKAQELLAQLHNLSRLCAQHKREYADIIASKAQNPIAAPAPSGISSLLPGARKRSASILAAKQQSLDVETHKDAAKQQQMIDSNLITIGWKIDVAISDLAKAELEIKRMYHARLATIRKQTGADVAHLKDSSST